MSNSTVTEVEQAMQTLLKHANYMGSERTMIQAMSKVLMNEHNTIQQTFWRIMKGVATEYAAMPYHDLRNEASVKFTKQIAESDVHLPFI